MASDIGYILDDNSFEDSVIFYKKGLCGLSNLGNTCYMNSILQCVNSFRVFVRFFLSDKYKDCINGDKIDHHMVEQWSLVCKGLYDKNCVITPSSFHRCVQVLSRDKGLGTFSGFDQNDSQEFLQFFLETLHNGLSAEVLMTINGKPENDLDKRAIQALTCWKEFFKNDYSQIIELFYGQLYSTVTTDSDTEFLSESFDPFSNLALEIPSNKERLNLYDCFDQFTKPELLDDFKQNPDDTYKYKRVLNLWKAPEIMVLFFKRFNNDGSKNDVFIDFPLENLNISNYLVGYDKEDCTYDLQAISNHSGGLGGGHYWAYTKNLDNNWYKYNDNLVSLKQVDDVVTSNAYCLFYKKR